MAFALNGNWMKVKGVCLHHDAWDIWNYDEGQNIRVVCYTNAPQARLLLNGKVVGGMKPYDEKTGIIYWDIPSRQVSFVLRAAMRKEMPCQAIPSGHPDVLMPFVPLQTARFYLATVPLRISP